MPDGYAQIDTLLSERQWVARLLRGPMSASTFSGIVSIAVQLVACLALGWLIGGSDNAAPHWYFLPILFAAVRFGPTGAFATALVAAVLAGPFTAADIERGIAQPPAEQVSQAIAFIVCGLGVAFLIEQAVRANRRRLDGHQLSRRVQEAIAAGDVTVEYQPIWTCSNKPEIVGAEALVRWVDGHHGPVPPGTFVPTLEEADELDDLGLWVIEQTCSDLARWRDGGLDIGTAFHVAVNVSSTQLGSEFVAMVDRALTSHDIPASALVLELTERTLLEDRATARSVLHELRVIGVRIAVDDFGTGFSSLAYLRDLQFDILKLDRAFIAALGSADRTADAVDRAIVGSILGLGRALGKELVVEGVESEGQLAALRDLGEPALQGSFLSPAEPAGALASRLDCGDADRPTPPLDAEGRTEPTAAIHDHASVPESTPSAPPPATIRARIQSWMRREINLSDGGLRSSHSYPAQVILAAMFLAGSLMTLLVTVVSDQDQSAAILLGASAVPCAWFLHHFRRQVQEWMLHLLLLAGTVIVLANTYVSPAVTIRVAGAACLIWVTVYASAFFELRRAVAHGLVAGIGLGVVFHLRPLDQDAAVWITIMGTAGVTGFVVGWFARQLQLLAATDALTGLPNRQSFETALLAEIDRAERANAPLAVAIVDLDDFKAINDEQGHLAGDRVLASLPGQWQAELRNHDLLARFGGDEFVVLLPNCPLDDAEDVMIRMSRAGNPSCSVGVVTLAWGEDSASILTRADEALYRAKSNRATVRADRSVPIEMAVGGSPRRVHPAGVGRG